MKDRKIIIPWSVQKDTTLKKVDKTKGVYFWVKKKNL